MPPYLVAPGRHHPCRGYRARDLHESWFYVLLVLIVGGVRLLLGQSLGSEAFKRRVLVLGAGPRAARVAALARRDGAGFAVAGFVGRVRPPAAEAVTVEVLARWAHQSLVPALRQAGGDTLAVRVWESPEDFGGYAGPVA